MEVSLVILNPTLCSLPLTHLSMFSTSQMNLQTWFFEQFINNLVDTQIE